MRHPVARLRVRAHDSMRAKNFQPAIAINIFYLLTSPLLMKYVEAYHYPCRYAGTFCM